LGFSAFIVHTMKSETPVKCAPATRRAAFPLNAGRQFVSASCALPSLSAAVAHLCFGFITQIP
jgi:hypothetical protein